VHQAVRHVELQSVVAFANANVTIAIANVKPGAVRGSRVPTGLPWGSRTTLAGAAQPAHGNPAKGNDVSSPDTPRSATDRSSDSTAPGTTVGTARVKRGMAEMLKGGVIMDVVTPEQAKIAEDAGAVAVMALERVPADIRRDGGVARMSDPDMIDGIIAAVSIPVMAKARIGHFAEAQVLQALGVDYVDESEVLTPADEAHHIDKWAYTVPFVCGATNLGEALRRISEGAAMIRPRARPAPATSSRRPGTCARSAATSRH
jgi:pyridoxal 5'-phosphate synthase pdxS subunit